MTAATLVSMVVDVSFEKIDGASRLVGEFIEGLQPQPLKVVTETNFADGVSAAQIHCRNMDDVKSLCGELAVFLSMHGGNMNPGRVSSI